MLKCASQFFVEKILPSIVATVTAAYIVNHYIAVKPDTPSTAAASAGISDKAGDTEAKVRAGGISEKGSATALDERGQSQKIPSEAAADKPAEKRATADTKKHQAPQREKAARIRSTPAVPAQTASAADDRRDANDLARAAIDRQRSPTEAPLEVETVRSQSQEPRAQQDADRQSVSPSRLQEVTHAAPQAAEPLPPATQVSASTLETSRFDPTGAGEGAPFDPADRARLPIPPENIPQASRPFDLKANAAAPVTRAQAAADDMLSAAKAVVETVLPR